MTHMEESLGPLRDIITQEKYTVPCQMLIKLRTVKGALKGAMDCYCLTPLTTPVLQLDQDFFLLSCYDKEYRTAAFL